MAYYEYNGYKSRDREINTKKRIKRFIYKMLFLLFFGTIFFFVFLNFYHKRVQKLIRADIEIEKTRLNNAIQGFKKRVGSYPELIGNEDSLSNIRGNTENVDFTDYYGSEKLFELPENLKNNVMKSNKVVTIKDNKGGWVYNKTTGEITTNF